MADGISNRPLYSSLVLALSSPQNRGRQGHSPAGGEGAVEPAGDLGASHDFGKVHVIVIVITYTSTAQRGVAHQHSDSERIMCAIPQGRAFRVVAT